MIDVRRLTARSLRWIAACLLTAGMALGAIIAPTPAARATAVSLRTPDSVHCNAAWLLRRNLGAMTVLWLGIATAGTMTMISLVVIGMVVSSAIVGFANMGIPIIVLLAGTVPHGIFEMSGFIWAGGTGLSGVRIASGMFSKDPSAGVEIRNEFVGAIRSYGIAAACLVIGALFECYVTPIVFGYAVESAGIG